MPFVLFRFLNQTNILPTQKKKSIKNKKLKNGYNNSCCW